MIKYVHFVLNERLLEARQCDIDIVVTDEVILTAGRSCGLNGEGDRVLFELVFELIATELERDIRNGEDGEGACKVTGMSTSIIVCQ